MKSDTYPILRIRMSIRNPIPTGICRFHRNLHKISIGSDCRNDSPGKILKFLMIFSKIGQVNDPP